MFGRRTVAALGVTLHIWHRLWLCALLSSLLPGCGGAAAGRVASALPAEVPADIRHVADRCDLGDMAACNRLGVWYHVGGGGEQARARGLALFRLACANGYGPSCRLVEDLQRGPTSP